MEKAFCVGDIVVYKAKGVFRIVAIGIPDFMLTRRLAYFTLKEVHAKNPKETFYVPDSSASYMRPVIEREKAEVYLEDFARLRPNPRTASRKMDIIAQYRTILDTCNVLEYLKLLKALYLRGNCPGGEQKMLEVDIQYRDTVEKAICDEFAYVLDVTTEEIKERLISSIHPKI